MKSHPMSFRTIGGLLCLLLLLGTVVQAAPGDDQRVVETMTSAAMRALFGDEGFTDVTIDDDDDLIVRMNGYRVLVMVRENDYSSIKFRFAISGTSATLKSVNDWNSSRKYTTAYLDEDGDPALQMDLDLAGGVTIARIKDGIRTFSQSQVAFLREVAID